MATYSLTQKQAEALAFITGYILERGVGPTFEEIKDALNLSSKAGVARLVNALCERGHIIRMPHRARSIALPNAFHSDTRDLHLALALSELRAAKTERRSRVDDRIAGAISHIEKARQG